MRVKLLLSILMILLINGGAFAQDPTQEDCPGQPPTRLERFTDARVTPGDANNIRREPSANARVLGQIPGGEVFNVLGSSACADGYRWWRVVYNGIEGWTVESTPDVYWVEPYTEPPPAPVATVTQDTVTVDTDTIEFSYPVALADGVTEQPRIGYMLEGSMSPHPNYVAYQFEDYLLPVEEYGPLAVIEIYPVAAFEALIGTSDTPIEQLQTLIADRSPLEDVEGYLPVLPYRNAAQIVHAQREYLDFQNGAGIRFVTFYAQDTVEIRSNLFYTFQGITADGAYYVSADFPITLPESAFPAFDQDAAYADDMSDGPINDYYREYVASLTANIDALDNASVTPSLDTLDALIGSMTVKGSS
jgi:hypothetical protein